MSFLDKITALIHLGRKKSELEYFFGLNITQEKLICSLWVIENHQLKILQVASEKYSSIEEIIPVTDKLLDETLGIKDLDPQKILFGVPSVWLSDENLKEEKLKILRTLVKELELSPMAYVESSHALIHLLEKTQGVPPTAILVGFESKHITVTVVRAGKLDGVKVVSRGNNSGSDIEKVLLSFTTVETLPSKIFIYGSDLNELKNELLAYSWMSKLSFLHFPKIENLPEDIEIKSICFAGASEIDNEVAYIEKAVNQVLITSSLNKKDEALIQPEDNLNSVTKNTEQLQKEDLGFMVGDVVSKEIVPKLKEAEVADDSSDSEELIDKDYLENNHGEELVTSQDANLIETDDFENELPISRDFESTEGLLNSKQHKIKFSFKTLIPKKSKATFFVITIIFVVLILLGAYLVLPKAEVKIFAEPKILERDAIVTADPNQKLVDEANRIIPGQIIETQVSGTEKAVATGQKEVGDFAKGTVVIYNKTFESKTLSKGTIISNSNGFKFSLDSSVNIASQSATDSGITFGKANATVIASLVGADSNLASGSELNVSNFSATQVSAKAEGNFSGGTSKKVTVVSSDDQSKLLASLASNLKKQAQSKLQEKLLAKKVLEEALLEEITTKSFSKNINDQASEFSLNLTSKYKGTAFEDKDLKSIVSKLVIMQVPEGFKLNLEDTETQAEVSKLEKNGKLIFLAKFKAKLMPDIDVEAVKKQIKGKEINQAVKTITEMANILGAEIKISPSIPFFQMLPMLSNNIKVEVGLK